MGTLEKLTMIARTFVWLAVAFIIAGHIAEIFLYRRDILESFLRQSRHIKLYTTQRAFQKDGGQAGGDYDPRTESLQLVLSRLVEGFFGDYAVTSAGRSAPFTVDPERPDATVTLT